MRRNPDSPWNPADVAEVTPTEYEEQVVAWLRRTGQNLMDFKVEYLRKLPGPSGEYELDAERAEYGRRWRP